MTYAMLNLQNGYMTYDGENYYFGEKTDIVRNRLHSNLVGEDADEYRTYFNLRNTKLYGVEMKVKMGFLDGILDRIVFYADENPKETAKKLKTTLETLLPGEIVNDWSDYHFLFAPFLSGYKLSTSADKDFEEYNVIFRPHKENYVLEDIVRLFRLSQKDVSRYLGNLPCEFYSNAIHLPYNEIDRTKCPVHINFENGEVWFVDMFFPAEKENEWVKYLNKYAEPYESYWHCGHYMVTLHYSNEQPYLKFRKRG